MSDIATQLELLNSIALKTEQDASNYPQILTAVIDVAQKQTDILLRRWCSNFFIGALTSEAVDEEIKRGFCLKLLDTVMLLLKEDDAHLQRNSITLSAIIYKVAFAHVALNPNEVHIWEQLGEMKTRIFSLWHASRHFGVEAECVKFAQQVIAIQMHNNRDPRLNPQNQSGSKSDFSLSDVPSGHPLITSTLEAESQGLLDRITEVFAYDSFESQVIISTLFALSSLMKSRPTLVSKIIPKVVMFEFWKKEAQASSKEEADLNYRYVDKSIRLFLQHSVKTVGGRFSHQINRYMASLGKPYERLAEKRKAEADLPMDNEADNKNHVKRIKKEQVKSATPPPPSFPPQPTFDPSKHSTEIPTTGNYSYRDLYTLIEPTNPLNNLEATKIPFNFAVNAVLASIATANPDSFAKALGVVQQRYKNFQQLSSQASASGSNEIKQENGTHKKHVLAPDENPPLDDNINTKEEEDEQMEVDEDQLQYEQEEQEEDLASLVPAQMFSLPAPTKLSTTEKVKAIDGITTRLIAYQDIIDSNPSEADANATLLIADSEKNAAKGFDSIAITEQDKKKLWVALLSRLLTRGIGSGKMLADSKDNLSNNDESETVTKNIREKLLQYCIENFWARLDITLEWLNEEWFFEYVELDPEKQPAKELAESKYFYYVSRVLDNAIPLVEMTDLRDFLRLWSDLPEFNKDLLWRLKSLCVDPDRYKIGFMSLTYLIRFKPPVKKLCLDLLEELYLTNPETRDNASGILKQHRPEFLEKQQSAEK